MDDEEIQDGQVLEEVLMVNFPLVLFAFVSFSNFFCLEDLSGKKKLDKHRRDAWREVNTLSKIQLRFRNKYALKIWRKKYH